MVRKAIKIFFLLCVGLVVKTNVFAVTYEEYLQQLDQTLGMNTAELSQQQVISRYDLIKLLNLIDCNDCHFPSNQLKSTLNNEWRKNFLLQPGNFFGDISFENTLYKQDDYYYCVAYGGFKDYMSGYPEGSSPVCPGKFCGANNTNYAEFIQVLSNILSQYVYQNFSADRKKVSTWYLGLSTSESAYRVINEKDREVLQDAKEKCPSGTCRLTSADELKLYVKYCTYNISDCDFIQFPTAKQGKWPVAELNILILQGVLSITEADEINVNKFVPGAEVLKTLFRISGKNLCTFDNDKDKDGVLDHLDSCYLDYDPLQLDKDEDGIKDVCDTDLDNDTVLNPAGVVDRKGHLIVSKITPTTDNCIFDKNVDQKDSNKNNVGDLCEDDDAQALAIQANPLMGDAPLKVDFEAKYVGGLGQIVWDFGDGAVGEGTKLSHTYLQPGKYTIIARGKNPGSQVIAQSTIIVGDQGTTNWGGTLRHYILPEKNMWNATLTMDYSGALSSVQWKGNNEAKSLDPKTSFKTILLTPGVYEFVGEGFNGQEKVIEARSYISVGDEIQAMRLVPSVFTAKAGDPINFRILTTNVDSLDISSIRRDLGANDILTDASREKQKVFNQPGKYLITATVIFSDNTTTTLQTTVTVYQIIPSLGADLDALPLVQNVATPINFVLRYVGIAENLLQYIYRNFDDGENLFVRNNFSANLRKSYSYKNPGTYKPSARIVLSNGDSLMTQATIKVLGTYNCLLKQYRCDLDRDTIADLCDDDIDGDGTKNFLGLIVYENPDCSFGTGNLNTGDILKEHQLASSGGDIDNCPFVVNDQTDNDRDGYGNICDVDGDNLIDSTGAVITGMCDSIVLQRTGGTGNFFVTIQSGSQNIASGSTTGQRIEFSNILGGMYVANVFSCVDNNCSPLSTLNVTSTAKICACPNGATNPTFCTLCPSGTNWDQSSQSCKCVNGAINPAECTICGVGERRDASSKSCLCINGAINPPTCSACPVGKIFDMNTQRCVEGCGIGTGGEIITGSCALTQCPNGKQPINGRCPSCPNGGEYPSCSPTLTCPCGGAFPACVSCGEGGEEEDDGDDVPTDVDPCPEIPENYNGIQDADGCPELPGGEEKGPFINTINCNSCPCQYAEFMGELVRGDQVKAGLFDKQGNLHYLRSTREIVR